LEEFLINEEKYHFNLKFQWFQSAIFSSSENKNPRLNTRNYNSSADEVSEGGFLKKINVL